MEKDLYLAHNIYRGRFTNTFLILCFLPKANLAFL